jgi:hypothetical protein
MEQTYGPQSETGAFIHAITRNRGKNTAALEQLPRGCPHAQTVLRAAITATTTTDASALAAVRVLSDGLIVPMTSTSVFDFLMENGAHAIPLHTRLVYAVLNAVGGETGEALPKRLSRFDLEAAPVQPRKSCTIIVLSGELASRSGVASQAHLTRLARASHALTTNIIVLAALADGAPTVAATGLVTDDLRALAEVVALSDAPQPVLVMSPLNGLRASLMTDANGQALFPSMTARGGAIGGVPALVAPGMDDDRIALVDASQVAAGSTPVMFDASDTADLQMDDEPASGGQALVSLWQTDSVALRLERFVGIEKIAAGAAAFLESVDWAAPAS